MDREKVIENLGKVANAIVDGYIHEPDRAVNAIADAISLLKEQNDNIGHWVVLENCSNAGVYCSECKTKISDCYQMKKKLSNFCPHCGTRMEGQSVRTFPVNAAILAGKKLP